jgi:DNA-binding LacI/PurR family transcriptional regulator
MPAYRRIEDDIRLKVQDGRLPAGSMLASRHNLAKEYGVALSTAQRAIANLIADGVLESLDRRGTFVARRAVSENQQHRPQISVMPSPQLLPTFRYAAPVRRAKTGPAKLGILMTSRIESTAPRDIGTLWAQLAIRAIEQAFSVDGGTTQFLDRFPERLGPYRSGFDDTNAIQIGDSIRSLVADGVDALAIVGLCDARDVSDEVVAAVDVERIPTVYISWHEIRPPLAQVYYDNRYAGYQAAQHLLNVGYRRLTFLAPFSGSWVTERIEGARDAVRHAGFPPDMLRVFPSEASPGIYIHDNTSEIAYAAALKAFDAVDFLAGGDTGEPWGIIAPNDHAALSILEAAAERGRVPGVEFGLVGFDDDPLSCSVGLTTVRPPVEAMGEAAAKLLLRAIGGERGGSQVRLRSNLIPRASTSRRPRTQIAR